MAVSGRYPLIEAICASLFVGVIWAAQPDDVFRVAVLWLLTIALLALTVIDLEFRRLPNGLVLMVLMLSGVMAWIDQRPAQEMVMACGITLSIGLFLRLIGRFLSRGPGLGWGDIKLALAISLNFTSHNLSIFLTVTGVCAACLIVWSLLKQVKPGVPLGPALCAGAFAALV